jgi:hypothetical protein
VRSVNILGTKKFLESHFLKTFIWFIIQFSNWSTGLPRKEIFFCQKLIAGNEELLVPRRNRDVRISFNPYKIVVSGSAK